MVDRYYIGLEDLAANAMIEILAKRQEDGRDTSVPLSVTFRDLEAYGAEVVDYINRTSDKKAVLLLSRDSTAYMFRNYSEYFEEIEEGEPAVKLREGKSINDLIEQFRMYLAFKVVTAFMAKETSKILYKKYT